MLFKIEGFKKPISILSKLKSILENNINGNNNRDAVDEILDVELLYQDYHDESLDGVEYNILEELNKLPNIVLIRMGATYNEFIKEFFMGVDYDFASDYICNLELSQIRNLSVLGHTDKNSDLRSDILESDDFYFYDDKVYDIYLENLADALRFYIRISMLYNKRFKLRTIVNILADNLSDGFKYTDIFNSQYSLSNILRSFILDWYERLVYPIIKDIQIDPDLPLPSRIKYRNAITNIVSYFEKQYNQPLDNDVLATLVAYTLYGFYNTPYIKENKSLNELLKSLVYYNQNIIDYGYNEFNIDNEGDVKDYLFKGIVFKRSISPGTVYVYLSYIAKSYFELHRDLENDDNEPLVIKESYNWK